ncbi:MAG: GTP cyclohydrolase, FolE2/MptA family, partial [Acidaminococcaceae bacterium]
MKWKFGKLKLVALCIGGSLMLKDVQGESDVRQVPLKHVGIKNLRWPISIRDKTKGEQQTVATISMA